MNLLRGTTGRTSLTNARFTQQFCRRFLIGMDRGGSNEWAMTHESLDHMLGGRQRLSLAG